MVSLSTCRDLTAIDWAVDSIWRRFASALASSASFCCLLANTAELSARACCLCASIADASAFFCCLVASVAEATARSD